MKRNKYYKVFIAATFPFLRAFLLGNTLSEVCSLLFFGVYPFEKAYSKFHGWFYSRNLILPYEIAKSLVFLGFFYLSIMLISKRKEWLDRMYELSTQLSLTGTFGALILINSIFEQAGYVDSMRESGLVFVMVVFLFIIPIVLLESVWLSLVIKPANNNRLTVGLPVVNLDINFKSLCYSFFMFLMAPLIVTTILEWLFVVIFLPTQ